MSQVNYEPIAISILNNLEQDIQTVLDASIPNKSQNRAASKMAADHFWRARALYVEATDKKTA